MGGLGNDTLDGGSGNDLLDENVGKAIAGVVIPAAIGEINTLIGGAGESIR
jgi:Ca2+-binding RTX toxin-like protein